MANKVILLGVLGADPELSYTPSGTAKAILRVATTERWTDKEGNKKENTEWHRVVAWGRKAEVLGEYFSKGKGIFIEGKLQTRSWEDRDGNKKWTTEIILANFEFIPGKAPKPGDHSDVHSDHAGDNSEVDLPQPDDDIPF